MIGEKEFWGLGYGSDAMRTICTFLFDRYRLRRIQLDIWSGNKRAIRCYSSLGLKVEGVLRQAILVLGEPTDKIIMGLLLEEFMPLTMDFQNRLQ